MSEHIIIAPHADDEVIGCFEILNSLISPTIIYTEPIDNIRLEETKKIRDCFDIDNQLYLKEIPGIFLKKENIFYFPDPVYELHPAHRKMGAIGEAFLRDGYDVIFYNTNMNAPYIHEVNNLDGKTNTLNYCYESQKTLWIYDAKYYLFEGRCKWLMGE
jgi:hypothetical protein